ncbi:LOW QUALITY PROTEIN: ornithine decarboxylase antizyme 3 [Pantherophis guttatus]|uniref:LOW QUALITY PROTEIN: ornithine decarboxylase antizyme 3 n=1 Tax=Pantherophis guttatus TaxID=94885 RepID=A0ABM3ZPI9_PANGU|nr:LOW QUALITY PROTEIN: ornithine decarboxylase antizyme 3 [Pantherophis guttatus]
MAPAALLQAPPPDDCAGAETRQAAIKPRPRVASPAGHGSLPAGGGATAAPGFWLGRAGGIPRATLARPETLSTRPRYCPQCSEFEGASPNRSGPSSPADWPSPTEIYKAANLTVFASDPQQPGWPACLDFHFTRGSQGASHWHGLLQGRTLFLDTPRLALDFNSRESLTATLEYIEEKTGAEQVLVNFRKARRDRGNLLRAFGFLGFELVTPDHPGLPPWEDTIFMAYPLERDLGWNPQRKQE